MYLKDLSNSHSFILLQTNSEHIAKNLPYVVYSHQSSILEVEDSASPVTYNWAFDCSYYHLQHKNLILTDKTPLPSLLSP